MRNFGFGLWALGLLAAATVTASCSSGPSAPVENADAYKKHIEEMRTANDAMFRDRSNPDNPIPAEKVNQLLPLSYYPVDPDYNVPAQLRPADEQPTFEMPTSRGTLRKQIQVGTLQFTVKGQPLTLVAFAGEGPGGAPDMRKLFVPFMDLTTGVETYEAGRYLDLERTDSGVYKHVFNAAYNPYCAYAPTWECPLPPSANRLKVAITAGERIKRTS